MVSQRFRRRGEMIVGFLAALLFLEVALRPLSSGTINLERLPKAGQLVSILDDPDDGPVSEVRYYHEGVATSHFSPARARMTGNRRLIGAPTGVIIGDSSVEAVQVDDDETMGAVVERAARASGVPLNVRQYGWSGASIGRYVSVAPDILARWSPPWVAVVLNDSDLVAASPPSAGASEAAVQPRASGMRARVARSANKALNELMGRSVLAAEVLRRISELRRGDNRVPGAPANAATQDPPLLPADAVRELKRAYGSRLAIVYFPHISAADDAAPQPLEGALLRECQAQQVVCGSTRQSMVRGYEARGRFVRGFSNTAPNVGHPNTFGHEVIGGDLWQAVAHRTPSSNFAGGLE